MHTPLIREIILFVTGRKAPMWRKHEAGSRRCSDRAGRGFPAGLEPSSPDSASSFFHGSTQRTSVKIRLRSWAGRSGGRGWKCGGVPDGLGFAVGA